MIVNPYKPFSILFRDLWIYAIPTAAYVGFVCILDLQYHLEIFNFPLAIVSIVGTVIGLLLAFRTNSAYARWWEARTLWGAIVNDSRSWVRQLLGFAGTQGNAECDDDVLRRMAYRQVAWCYALARGLRGQTDQPELQALLDESEIHQYSGTANLPNALLLQQGIELRQLYHANRIELFQYIELEQTLVRLTNSMGGCERIRNTVFPSSYSSLVNALVFLFVFFLPLGLVNVPAPWLLTTSMALAFAFQLTERVAVYLQDPFANRPSDTPMLALSTTIEINIRQMLGETELPAPRQPINGVLD